MTVFEVPSLVNLSLSRSDNAKRRGLGSLPRFVLPLRDLVSTSFYVSGYRADYLTLITSSGEEVVVTMGEAGLVLEPVVPLA